MGSKEIAGVLKKSPRKGIASCLPTCHPGGVIGGPFSGRKGGEKPCGEAGDHTPPGKRV